MRHSARPCAPCWPPLAGADYGSRTAQLIAKHGFPGNKRLGAGVIDGRGAWAECGEAARLLGALRSALGPNQTISVQAS